MALSSPILSAEVLSERLDDPELRVVDVRWVLGSPGRGREAYDAGHIPGAIFLDVDTDLVAAEGPGRHPLPSPTEFRARLEAAGIRTSHTVVSYDDVGDRSRRRSEPNAMAADHIGIGERVRRGVDPHAQAWHQPPTLPTDREVNLVGDDVGQAQEHQGRFVRDDRPWPLLQPRRDDLLTRFRRVVPQAVQTAADAQEAARPRVVGQQRRAEAVSGGLFRGEVPSLPAGRLEERLVIRASDSLVVHTLNCT